VSATAWLSTGRLQALGRRVGASESGSEMVRTHWPSLEYARKSRRIVSRATGRRGLREHPGVGAVRPGEERGLRDV